MQSRNELTPAEMRLVAAYRSVDERGKWLCVRQTEMLAGEYRAAPERPKLRLIKGSQPCG